jgi:imidazolonepropionase-like amidohydrolase
MISLALATVVVIRGATLIDGAGAPPLPDAAIVIEGGKILAVGPSAQVKAPPGAEVVEAAGKFIIPGLVDLHTHPPVDRAEAEKVLRTYLHFGVTTIRSLGVDGPHIWALREDQRTGKLVAPRIFTAGQGFAHPQGWPANDMPHRPLTPEQAREQVRSLAARRVDFVKMWVDTKDGSRPKIDFSIAGAIIREAARHGIPSAAHIFEYEDCLRLASLGINELVHMVRDRDEVPREFIERMKSQGISFTPTMAKMEGDWIFYENPYAPQLRDPEYVRLMGPEAIVRLKNGPAPEMTPALLAQRKKEFQRAQRITKQLFDGGVRIGVGSDGPVFPVAHGYGTHVELRVVREAGLPPLAAIQAATNNGARRLVQGEPDFGTIAPGMAADLVILHADPVADIHNSRRIDRVMQAGRWVR